MYLMFKRSPRYILMIVIMAVGMMMSSMGTFASHGTNGLTGYEMNLHDAEVTMTVQDHSHDSDILSLVTQAIIRQTISMKPLSSRPLWRSLL
jgi:hypothetical protein